MGDSDVEAVLGNGAKTTQVLDVDADFHVFKRKKEGTWVNAMMFYQAWLNIREQQLSAGSDWVIKVDADSVFLPARRLSRGRAMIQIGSMALGERTSSCRTAWTSSLCLSSRTSPWMLTECARRIIQPSGRAPMEVTRLT